MAKKITITKLFAEIPFAHRQHTHEGHCRYVHGHSWSFKVKFEAAKLDKNGFVIDFGKLSYLKEWIANNLDHALVLSSADPYLHDVFAPIAQKDLAKLLIVPACSAEGLSEYLQDIWNKMTLVETDRRVRVVSVEVFEDSKNAAVLEEV